jgi:hypothetical protein
MKKSLTLILLLVVAYNAQAQVKFNPQIGVTAQKLSNSTVSSKTTTTLDADFRAQAGFMIGADARIGKRFYFQPGIFFLKNTTIQKLKGDTLTLEDFENKIYRTSFKLKGMLGYNLVHKDGFKLRVNAGPTYDFIANIDNSESIISDDDFNKGSFNMDAAVGVDIWFLTGEVGYSYGLTKAYKDNDDFNLDSKYSTIYISVGIVL